MTTLASRVFRYGRAWVLGPDDVVEDEIMIDRDGTPIPATLVLPRAAPAPLPAWVVLHGVTRPGRAHAQLVRFTRSLASAGMATIVPEVPEWREMSLAPRLTAPTVAAAVRGMRDAGFARDHRLGLVGFSFGAPHAIAAAHHALRDEIGGVCGFGGYCSLEHTFRFMMSGRHAWAGRQYRQRPDPYGRWIVAANYLTSVPGREDAVDVADALRSLARHTGDVGAASWDPVYDPEIRRLRGTVAEERRALFDIFARESVARDTLPGASTEAPTEHGLSELAEALASAARRRDPALDPSDAFREVEGQVHVLHGRSDNLIPFTESHRLARALPRAQLRLTVTRLFGHSGGEPWAANAILRDLPRFIGALRGVLSVV